MSIDKRSIVKFFFCGEVITLFCFYFFGAQGIYVMLRLHEENGMVTMQVEQLERDVADLGNQLNAWKNNPFLHEKFAREQLHMAHPDDTIFYLS